MELSYYLELKQEQLAQLFYDMYQDNFQVVNFRMFHVSFRPDCGNEVNYNNKWLSEYARQFCELLRYNPEGFQEFLIAEFKRRKGIV